MSTSSSALLSLALNREGNLPMHVQLTQQFRLLILNKRLSGGEKLPSSRFLATELSVSRITVTAALEQLISEGYAEARHGAGTFVTSNLPDYEVDRTTLAVPANVAINTPARTIAFAVGTPETKTFPFKQWTKLFERTWANPDDKLLDRGDAFGWWPLRVSICDHLHRWRGITCAPAQIVITHGLESAVQTVTNAAFNMGDEILVEDPGAGILQSALRQNNLICSPVRVDDNGFDIATAARNHPNAAGVAVTPSRHYPLGMTLPVVRRLELLEWAKRTGGFILEDDFDSEYRYEGEPLPALMSLDRNDSVVYLGSFSKTMFPGLRLGFMVLPVRLVDKAQARLATNGRRASIIMQPVLSRFMDEGLFATHLRKMRRLYYQRQKALLHAIDQLGQNVLAAQASPASMHLVVRLSPEISKRLSDIQATQLAADAGVSVRPLSRYYESSHKHEGLVLGYAAFNETEIQEGVVRLLEALK